MFAGLVGWVFANLVRVQPQAMTRSLPCPGTARTPRDRRRAPAAGRAREGSERVFCHQTLTVTEIRI